MNLLKMYSLSKGCGDKISPLICQGQLYCILVKPSTFHLKMQSESFIFCSFGSESTENSRCFMQEEKNPCIGTEDCDAKAEVQHLLAFYTGSYSNSDNVYLIMHDQRGRARRTGE